MFSNCLADTYQTKPEKTMRESPIILNISEPFFSIILKKVSINSEKTTSVNPVANENRLFIVRYVFSDFI